jgi:uncharacterized protein YneF (UPF0154 family)
MARGVGAERSWGSWQIGLTYTEKRDDTIGSTRGRAAREASVASIARAESLRGFRFRQVVIVEIFLGILLGLLAGMFLCARYLRQEIAANIGPRLTHIERQLETLQSELNLDAVTRLAALSDRLEARCPRP